MIRLLILGATGSIGTTCTNALLSHLADEIEVVGLTASSSPSLPDRARLFNAPYCYADGNDWERITGFIDQTDPDIVLNAIAGSAGLRATLAVISRGKKLALANKESVVMGGHFMLDQARKSGSTIIPVDSEHSAIYHLLKGHEAEKLIITASGGPFADREDTSDVSVEEALHHPTWKMGEKITIDSATLANKGLEVMEASLLFGFPPDKIEVTIHRQSIVHSMIETTDGAVYALMSPPDMTMPIMLALKGEGNSSCPLVSPLSFSSPLSLTFENWDSKRFPMLSMAYEALRRGGGYRIAYTAADETAVNAFLSGRISFDSISRITEKVLDSAFTSSEPESYEEICAISEVAHSRAEALC